jgi:hypothetical protein
MFIIALWTMLELGLIIFILPIMFVLDVFYILPNWLIRLYLRTINSIIDGLFVIRGD